MQSNLDQLLLPAGDPLLAPGDAAASGGAAEASPARKRALRMLTPEWTKLLSLSPADWAALVQGQAPSPEPPSLAGLSGGSGESGARPPSQAAVEMRPPSQHSAAEVGALQQRAAGASEGPAGEDRGGRKRELSPSGRG